MRNYLILIVRNQYNGIGGVYYHRHDWLTVFGNRVRSKRGVPEARQKPSLLICTRHSKRKNQLPKRFIRISMVIPYMASSRLFDTSKYLHISFDDEAKARRLFLPFSP